MQTAPSEVLYIRPPIYYFGKTEVAQPETHLLSERVQHTLFFFFLFFPSFTNVAHPQSAVSRPRGKTIGESRGLRRAAEGGEYMEGLNDIINIDMVNNIHG